MKRYRFVVFISLLLAVTLLACQSKEVVETATPVPPTATATPQALQQLGVSKVVVESMVDLKPGQEIVLTDISTLVDGKSGESTAYIISKKMQSISAVDPLVFLLPLTPHGNKVDFNGEGQSDPGVQIYALKIQDALVESAPLSGEYADLTMPPLAGLSLQFSGENYANIASGWMLVWAADNQQLFPVGCGDDGVLFTDDDPVQPLELGYTALLYEDGVIARFRESSSRVVFSTNHAPLTFDLSGMDASAAYDESLSVLQDFYPEWNDEKTSDLEGNKSSYSNEELQFSAMVVDLEDDMVKYEPEEGGYMWLKSLYPADYGIYININAENEVRAYEIRLNGPAEEAGLELGDEILKVNGQPVLDAINAVEPPLISAKSDALQQKLKGFFLFRGEKGQEMELEIKTLKGEDKIISMESEINSGWLLNGLKEILGSEYAASLPVTYENERDYGYIQVNDFGEDPLLTRSMFLESLEKIKDEGQKYLVLDYRKANGNQFVELAGYFTDKDLNLGSLNCLGAYTQPVVVHPAEKQFDFAAIVVIVDEACSGACELEALAMQQMESVTIYGLHETAGIMDIGMQATIVLPEQNSISFPVCKFSNELQDEKMIVEPDHKLTNSYYVSIAQTDVLIREAFADLLIRNKIVGEPEEKLQARTHAEIYKVINSVYSPNYTIDFRILEMMKFHDIQHIDLYDVIHEDDDLRILFFDLCSVDYQTKVENNKNLSLSVSMDNQLLTDFVMSTNNFENDDIFGRYKEQPCTGWLVSYQELTIGHHDVLVSIDVTEPVFYDETFFEPGSYEFNLHYLVLEKEEEVEESVDD